MSTLQDELDELLEEENRKYREAFNDERMYEKKNYEILEGEVREVLPDEGILVRENPLDFPASVQRKYFGAAAEDWKFPDSEEMTEEGLMPPPGHYLSATAMVNPYTKEKKIIYTFYPIPRNPKEVVLENLKNGSNNLEDYEFSDIEIGDIITSRVFQGNPYAQMVLQAKATESMFRKVAGQGTLDDDMILTKKNLVMQEINTIRALFSLQPM